ncbi:MAG TPA: DUF2752 domain-containing protein [Pilimelia sp.]|nr:DUF2752 domain-containing protein [Pilimelia sp.]
MTSVVQPGAGADTGEPPAPAVPGTPVGAAGPGWAAGPYPVAPPGRFAAAMTRFYRRTPGWLGPAAVFVCLAGAAGFVLATDRVAGAADAAPTCLLKLTTGFDCPGCGGTRAFTYLLLGDVPAAARHHLVFVFAVPFLLYLYADWTLRQVSGRRLPALPLRPAVVSWFLAAWFVFSVARNLPWTPFTWFFV